jgi:hypothetical protein
MADTAGCCGGPRGKHLPGCDGNKANQKFKAARDRVDASEKKAAEDYVRRYGHIGRDTRLTAGRNGVPHGVRFEKRGSDGLYYPVLG